MPDGDPQGRINHFAQMYLQDQCWETTLNAEDFAAAPQALKQALERSIHPPREELYDLQNDPTELVNLAGQASLAAVQAELRQTLIDWQQRLDDRIAVPGVMESLGKMHQEMFAEHYDLPRGMPRDKKLMRWQYTSLLDPGVPAG